MRGAMSLAALNSVSRKYVHQSFQHFNKVPKEADWKNLNDDQKLYMLELSEAFRSSLNDLSVDINDIAENLNSDPISADREHVAAVLDNMFDTAYGLEKSWHICEIFLLNPTMLSSIEFSKWLKDISYSYPLEVHVAHFEEGNITQPEYQQVMKMGTSGPEQAGTAQGPQNIGYWDLLYQLILQGSLTAAHELLLKHSEISLGLQSDERMPQSSRQISRSECIALLDALSSHPFAATIAQSNLNSSASASAGRSTVAAQTATRLSAEFSSWQQRVKQLQHNSTAMALFQSIPELDMVLRLLLGEADALEVTAAGQWGPLTLGLLLYVYPPPLSRTDVCRIVESAITAAASRGSGVSSSSDRNCFGNAQQQVSYLQVMREVMAGKIGPVLRAIFELSQSSISDVAAISSHSSSHSSSSSSSSRMSVSISNSSASEADLNTHQWGVVPLLAAAHLTMMLVCGGGQEDLLLPLSREQKQVSDSTVTASTADTSFFEEVFLAASARLHYLEFPVQVVLGYLSVCPLKGRDYARLLLPSRRIHSDSHARQVASALYELHWTDEAAAVLVSRGIWWLTKNDDSIHSRPSSGQQEHEQETFDSLFDCLNGSTLAKAAMFFREANDAIRLGNILERTLIRCMVAVTRCQQLFPSLTLFPSSTVAVGATGTTTTTAAANLNDTTSSQSIVELYAALTEANEILAAVGCTPVTFNGSHSQGSSTALELVAASALQQHSVAVATDTNTAAATAVYPPRVLTRMKCTALQLYVCAIQSRFSTNAASTANTAADTDAVASTLARESGNFASTNDLVHHMMLSPSVPCLRVGAQILATLITYQTENTLIPMRCWLHVLELTAWFHDTAVTLVQQESAAASNVSMHDDNDSDNNDINDDDEVAASRNADIAIFSKNQAYDLLCALQDLHSANAAEHFVAAATTPTGATTTEHSGTSGIGSTSNDIIGDYDRGDGKPLSAVEKLRLSLLAILCRSIVQENGIFGAQNMKQKRETAQHVFDMNGQSSLALRSTYERLHRREHPSTVQLLGTAGGGGGGGAVRGDVFGSIAAGGTRGNMSGISRTGWLHGQFDDQVAHALAAEDAAFEMLTASGGF